MNERPSYHNRLSFRAPGSSLISIQKANFKRSVRFDILFEKFEYLNITRNSMMLYFEGDKIGHQNLAEYHFYQYK